MMRTTILTGLCCLCVGVLVAQQAHTPCDIHALVTSIGGFSGHEAVIPERAEVAFKDYLDCAGGTPASAELRFLIRLGVAAWHASGSVDRTHYDMLWKMAVDQQDGYCMALLTYQGAVLSRPSRLERGRAYVRALKYLSASDSSESRMAAKLHANVATYRVDYGLEGDWRTANDEAARIYLRQDRPTDLMDHWARLAERLARRGDLGAARSLVGRMLTLCEERDPINVPMALKAKGTVAYFSNDKEHALNSWRSAADLCLTQARQGAPCNDCDQILANFIYMNGIGEGRIALMGKYLPLYGDLVEARGNANSTCEYLWLQGCYKHAIGDAHTGWVFAQWAEDCFGREQGEEHTMRLQLMDLKLRTADQLGDLDLARKLAQEAAAYHKAHNDPSEWNKTWANFAMTLRNNDRYGEALGLLGSDSLRWESNFDNLENYGVLLATQGQWERSDSLFRMALSAATSNTFEAKVHAWMARNAIARDDVKGAQEHLDHASSMFVATVSPNAELRLSGPALDRLNNELSIVQMVQAELDIYRYRSSGSKSDLVHALTMMDEVQEQLDLLLQSGFTSSVLQGRYKELLGLRLSVLGFLELTPRERQQQLLSSMESMRSRDLRNSLLRNQFTHDESIRAYDSLNAQIHAQVQASRGAVMDPDPSSYSDLAIDLSKLHEAEQRVLSKRTAPGYLSTGPWMDLDSMMAWANRNSTYVLSYLQTEDALHILWIGPDGSLDHTKRVSSVEVDRTVAILRSELKAGKGANDVLRKLGSMVLPTIPRDTRHDLLILTDGALDMIPFELLPIGNEDGSLIDRWNIRYGYSFQQSFLPRTGTGNGLVAYAPAYGQLRSDETDQHVAVDRWLFARSAEAKRSTTTLVHNLIESKAIASLFDGTLLTGDSATEASFRSSMAIHSIVHFAGHAFSLPNDPLLSGLVMTNVSRNGPVNEMGFDPVFFQDDGILHAFEIEDMHLPVDLVVLSACQSGTGSLKAGEGTLSLARSFMAAGAHNVVMSLWKVDDLATKEIMVKFYEKLADGMGKADALADAKRWYRKEYPNEPPSKWAAFILIGDNEPVQLHKPMRSMYWAIGLALVGVLGGALWLHSRRNAA